MIGGFSFIGRFPYDAGLMTKVVNIIMLQLTTPVDACCPNLPIGTKKPPAIHAATSWLYAVHVT